MIYRSAPADYFSLLQQHRTLSKEGSTTDGLERLANMVIAAINEHRSDEALCALQGLKKCFDKLRDSLDGDIEREHKAQMEYMVLRKENLELQLMIAKLTGKEQAESEIQGWINDMDEFFTAAIAELDPDRL